MTLVLLKILNIEINMKHLIIITAGGFGREIYDLATEAVGYQTDFVIKGFIDDNLQALDRFNGYPPILGSVDDYQIFKDDVFVCAVGSVKTKKKLTEKIIAKGGEFYTLISKSASISKMNVQIGKGCIICADARLHCEVKVGNHVTIQPKAILGHDVVVEDWCLINAFADCGGASHLEEGATMHTTSFLLPEKRMGAYSTLGAGSVAIRNIKPGAIMLGVPAKEVPVPQVPDRK